MSAVERVLQHRTDVLADQQTTDVPLDSIAGRTLATSIRAEWTLPEHDHATMGGFAFDATDLYPLTIRETDQLPENNPEPSN